jgi:alkanesulfonate monooxygenase SsuD/methylene tetrahydromethanopterin reductase-like flavin-dependent oxidoreductase (luciferase family)
VVLAEEIATLDVVTEGRLVFGAGLGYRPEEFDYLGIPFKERAGRFDESLELMKLLWTEEDVTFHGRYFTLEDVHPHLFPVQKPHPPIWIGAHAEAGVRRAGKYGDAYACPPETPKEEVARRYAIVRDGFALRGKEFGPQPLRRNCLVADTREEAMVEYARVAQGRYLTYAAKGLDVMKDTDLENEFAKAVSGHAVIGSPDEVITQLTDYVTALPVDPLLVRPQWPTMTADETIATLDRWGRDIVPAITAITPRRDIDEALLAPVAT